MLEYLQQLSERFETFNSKNFYIITGIPKSGTTWVHMLCNTHPQSRCHGEDDYNRLLMGFSTAMNDYNSHSNARNIHLPSGQYCQFYEEDMQRLIAASIAMMLTESKVPDKIKTIGTKFNDMIMNNTSFFSNLFKKALIIHVVRDPRDALVSIYHNNLRVNYDTSVQRWPKLSDMIGELAPTLVIGIKNARSIRQERPNTFHEIRYEDLSHNGPSTAVRLFDFLGIDSSPQIINSCLSQTSFEKLSGGRKPGTEDTSSFMRKGTVGGWRESMDEKCMEALDSSGINALVSELGYPP